MAFTRPVPQAVALLAAALAAAAQAQSASDTLQPVTITGSGAQAPRSADVTGFGDLPLHEVPLSATVVPRSQIERSGARRLADLTRFDASVVDAYNAGGYWDYLAIRGFTLDNRFNYRREGLPISAQTVIPLENKERIEILKGTSGIQAGTSAPGGLVNYVVKRPPQKDVRSARLQWTQRASVLGALDLGGRAGADNAFGWRLNAAHEELRPRMRDIDGERSLLAGAAEWRLDRDSLLEAEFEWSRQSQRSQGGFSLLGPALPAVPDPRINLNNQPWALPVVMQGFTGTLRYERAINADWRWSAQLGTQRLRADDRMAFPTGCSTEGNYDRYCSDGRFDVYDWRSDDERRDQHAAQLALKGSFATGAIGHDLSLGLTASRARVRVHPGPFNWVGLGHVDGQVVLPADPTPSDEGTNRDERSLEFSLHDAIRLSERLTTWVGLRHTRLDRQSVRTDGSRPSDYDQGVTTPWLAVSYKLSPATMAYASWGQGIESEVVPNRSAIYSNPGQVLPALKSRQVEVGLKGRQDALAWQLALFQITRPMSNVDACSRLGIAPCEGQFDGEARHRGLEASAQWEQGAWRLGAGVTLLDARRQGSRFEPAVNGQRPTNVPDHVLRAQAAWRVPNLTGLELQAQLSHEGRRHVLPDGSIRLPSWTRVDAALHYERRIGATATSWTFGIDNLFDRRYWRESPYQFGHVYLYPGAPRSLRVAFNAAL